MSYSSELKYLGNEKELASERFLSKAELKSFFGEGIIKLRITRVRNRFGKAHSDQNNHAWLIRSRFKTKTKKEIFIK